MAACRAGAGRAFSIPFIEMEKMNSSCSIVPYKAMNGLLFFPLHLKEGSSSFYFILGSAWAYRELNGFLMLFLCPAAGSVEGKPLSVCVWRVEVAGMGKVVEYACPWCRSACISHLMTASWLSLGGCTLCFELWSCCFSSTHVNYVV